VATIVAARGRLLPALLKATEAPGRTVTTFLFLGAEAIWNTAEEEEGTLVLLLAVALWSTTVYVVRGSVEKSCQVPSLKCTTAESASSVGKEKGSRLAPSPCLVIGR